jgi:hypothetical protein
MMKDLDSVEFERPEEDKKYKKEMAARFYAART